MIGKVRIRRLTTEAWMAKRRGHMRIRSRRSHSWSAAMSEAARSSMSKSPLGKRADMPFLSLSWSTTT
jgi:hypothetical protein